MIGFNTEIHCLSTSSFRLMEFLTIEYIASLIFLFLQSISLSMIKHLFVSNIHWKFIVWKCLTILEFDFFIIFFNLFIMLDHLIPNAHFSLSNIYCSTFTCHLIHIRIWLQLYSFRTGWLNFYFYKKKLSWILCFF